MENPLGNVSWVVAIVLAVFMWASLSMFPNYYRHKKVYLTIRIVLIIFLLFTQIERTVYLGGVHQKDFIDAATNPNNPNYDVVQSAKNSGLYLNNAYEGQEWYQNPVNYFLLYFCSIAAWATLIVLIFPSKKVMECFFPFMLMGPIVTFIFPTEKPLFWSWSNDHWDFINWFTFFFGHGCTLFGTMYIYLYGHTGYKFNKSAVVKSMVTGAIVVLGVETWNRFFGTKFITDDVIGALGLQNWSRFWVMFFLLTVGILYLSIGLSFAYFFKPIYEKGNEEKLHDTWWERFVEFTKLKYNQRKEKLSKIKQK
ncbi:hypothetical protein SHELI_v1c10820 [Spiroplasma helicoides]|uniref:Uncharacterized protein n=1 Tax=Spiroplasma helicoides TaxID=216938 RepID=A0A1B3SM68_9MOLU|nr:YwaF family protein [Spiroplasma helicoides]AOG61029.1 hypothetical protein SHELI_v1c10820 [Spiroplasma helicoides]